MPGARLHCSQWDFTISPISGQILGVTAGELGGFVEQDSRSVSAESHWLTPLWYLRVSCEPANSKTAAPSSDCSAHGSFFPTPGARGILVTRLKFCQSVRHDGNYSGSFNGHQRFGLLVAEEDTAERWWDSAALPFLPEEIKTRRICAIIANKSTIIETQRNKCFNVLKGVVSGVSELGFLRRCPSSAVWARLRRWGEIRSGNR